MNTRWVLDLELFMKVCTRWALDLDILCRWILGEYWTWKFSWMCVLNEHSTWRFWRKMTEQKGPSCVTKWAWIKLRRNELCLCLCSWKINQNEQIIGPTYWCNYWKFIRLKLLFNLHYPGNFIDQPIYQHHTANRCQAISNHHANQGKKICEPCS